MRQLRTRAGLAPSDLELGEVCSAELLRAVEQGESDPGRVTAEYLDRRLCAGGRLVDAWARAVISTYLDTGGAARELARQAGQVWEFEPGQLPRSLQTEDYARALAQARRPGSFGPVQLEAHRRQARSPHGATSQYTVIVNEVALRAIPGGAGVARDQLQHLHRFLERDRVSLQVVPARVRSHPCPSGTFRLLGLSPNHRLVHLAAPCGPGQLLSTPAEARDYAELFTALAAAALPREDSADLVATLLRKHTAVPPALPAADREPTSTPPARSEASRVPVGSHA